MFWNITRLLQYAILLLLVIRGIFYSIAQLASPADRETIIAQVDVEVPTLLAVPLITVATVAVVFMLLTASHRESLRGAFFEQARRVGKSLVGLLFATWLLLFGTGFICVAAWTVVEICRGEVPGPEQSGSTVSKSVVEVLGPFFDTFYRIPAGLLFLHGVWLALLQFACVVILLLPARFLAEEFRE